MGARGSSVEFWMPWAVRAVGKLLQLLKLLQLRPTGKHLGNLDARYSLGSGYLGLPVGGFTVATA